VSDSVVIGTPSVEAAGWGSQADRVAQATRQLLLSPTQGQGGSLRGPSARTG
jgi:hypothetical protein